MELVGSGLSKKKNNRNGGTRKNEKYFDEMELVYLFLNEAELNGRLSRVMRTLLEIDEIIQKREIASLGEDKAIDQEAA